MKEKYIPGEGCQCSARCSCECGCDVDWTPREVYELRVQRDSLAEAMRHFMSDTPETDAEHAQFPMGGFTLDFARKLERERDRLAEALRELCETLLADKPRDITELLNKAGDALAAVEGGSHDH
jgi:hypothetical protein